MKIPYLPLPSQEPNRITVDVRKDEPLTRTPFLLPIGSFEQYLSNILLGLQTEKSRKICFFQLTQLILDYQNLAINKKELTLTEKDTVRSNGHHMLHLNAQNIYDNISYSHDNLRQSFISLVMEKTASTMDETNWIWFLFRQQVFGKRNLQKLIDAD